MQDIRSIEDIQQFVNTFYSKIRQNALTGDIFESVIQDNWAHHLDKMYRFWDSVLFNSNTYIGHPFLAHAKLPINERHFEVWLKLFNETADELFEGNNVNRLKWQASQMALMFQRKLNEYKLNTKRKPII